MRLGAYLAPSVGRQAPQQAPLPAIYLDTTVGQVIGPVLVAGKTYTVTVTGTVSDWNLPLAKGNPLPDAAYPTTGGSARKSTQTGLDADTLFAWPSSGISHTAGHWTQFRIDGVHVEPEGGPYTSPASGHSYTYKITGKGAPVVFGWRDAPLNDNYGKLHIVVS